MAAKKQSVDDVPSVAALDRIALLLAAHVTREMRTEDATSLMEGAGFKDREITELLGVSESYVRQVRFKRKRKGTKGRKKAKAT